MWISGILLWNLRRASCKGVFQSKEPYVKISEMSNSKFCFADSVILRKNVTSIVCVIWFVLATLSLSLWAGQSQRGHNLHFFKGFGERESRWHLDFVLSTVHSRGKNSQSIEERVQRVMIFGKKCWFILRAVDAQLFRETIAHRLNIIELFLGGDILIEILEICRYQIYSKTIADMRIS